METKQFEGHTPGPWQDAEGDFDGPPVVIKLINGSRLRIAVCDFSTYRMALNSISLRTSETEDTAQFSTKVERANAALIAAAPDLLKELSELKSENDRLNGINKETWQELCDRACDSGDAILSDVNADYIGQVFQWIINQSVAPYQIDDNKELLKDIDKMKKMILALNLGAMVIADDLKNGRLHTPDVETFVGQVLGLIAGVKAMAKEPVS